MPLRASQVQTLLRYALAERRRADEQVAAASAALRLLQDRLELCRRQLAELAPPPPPQAAAARINRERYRQRLQRLRGELVEQVEQGHERLEQRRAQLVAAARQVRLWERLAARLEQASARRQQRLEQELIDEFGQRHTGPS